MDVAHSGSHREVIATVRGKQIAACRDKDSQWIEITGPKGGNAWELATRPAIELALALGNAVAWLDRVENGGCHDFPLSPLVRRSPKTTTRLPEVDSL